MAELTDTMVLELDELQLNVQKNFEGMAIQNTLLHSALRTELKNQSTNIQATLKAQLEALLRSNHTDFDLLNAMTKDELRSVQYILNATKNEQGYQSNLLRVISEKNLTVNIHNVVNVQNKIDIVADKSDFK